MKLSLPLRTKYDRIQPIYYLLTCPHAVLSYPLDLDFGTFLQKCTCVKIRTLYWTWTLINKVKTETELLSPFGRCFSTLINLSYPFLIILFSLYSICQRSLGKTTACFLQTSAVQTVTNNDSVSIIAGFGWVHEVDTGAWIRIRSYEQPQLLLIG